MYTIRHDSEQHRYYIVLDNQDLAWVKSKEVANDIVKKLDNEVAKNIDNTKQV